jgi:hypothetical protein
MTNNQQVCQWCGETFTRPHAKGPTPKYCSPAHRQQAHRARKRARSVTGVEGLPAGAASKLVPMDAGALSGMLSKFQTLDTGALSGVVNKFQMINAGVFSGMLDKFVTMDTAALSEAVGKFQMIDASVFSGMLDKFVTLDAGVLSEAVGKFQMIEAGALSAVADKFVAMDAAALTETINRFQMIDTAMLSKAIEGLGLDTALDEGSVTPIDDDAVAGSRTPEAVIHPVAVAFVALVFALVLAVAQSEDALIALRDEAVRSTVLFVQASNALAQRFALLQLALPLLLKRVDDD